MTSDISKEYSFDRYEIFKIKMNNNLLYLGSKYNMKKYIDNIQQNLKNTSKLYDIVVFGSGNGIWLENIDNITNGKRILIIEPDYNLFKIFLSKNHNVFDNEVNIICMEEDGFYTNLLSAIETSKIKIFIFSNYDFVYKERFEEFIDKIKDVIVDISVMENTNRIYSKTWLENYMRNLPEIINSNYINKYMNIFKDKPAIVVSAGPSLDKNIKLLKGNEEKFIIISVGRALKALKRENIKADFTAVIDGSEQMYKVFEDSLESDIPLLFSEQSGNKIVKNYKGEKIFFSTNDFINSHKVILGCNPIKLFQGGSVAHACIDFARVLGCSTIIFIGQDLAYTDNKTHSDTSIADFEDNKIKGDTQYWVRGLNEKNVKTSFDLNIFRERIELMVRLYNNITFINATEGGAHIEGTIEENLKDIINKYDKIIDKSILKENFKLEISKKEVIDKLKKIYNDIDDVIALCKEAILINENLLELYLKSFNKYSNALNRLDEIDKYIQDKKQVTNVFETLINVINNDIIKTFADEEYCEIITGKIKKISEKGKFLNYRLIEAFNYGKPLIKESIDKLEEI